MTKRNAIVAGALGLTGRALLRSLGNWEVIALSRRAAVSTDRTRFTSVDLTDPQSCRTALVCIPPVQYIFFCAYVSRRTLEEEVSPNLAMLANLIEAVEARSPQLQRVILVQGSK
jgi:nucleoside-diphosphate-sugar epimerase